jgi:hypothetical protein
LSVLMVVAMTWLVIPSLTRLFRGWLMSASPPSARPPSPHRRHTSTTGLQPGGG